MLEDQSQMLECLQSSSSGGLSKLGMLVPAVCLYEIRFFAVAVMLVGLIKMVVTVWCAEVIQGVISSSADEAMLLFAPGW